jgi:adenylate kinase
VDVVEVRDLALARGLAQRHRGTVAVDLARLGRRFHRIHSQRPYEVYVGHLAHLLPIRDVVVLRCHPKTLARRLRRARRGSARDRRENVEAEAIDLVLLEALALGRRVWEIDTTRRTPEAVARAVLRRVRRRGPPEYGQVRWLADRRVTDYLLDEAR